MSTLRFRNSRGELVDIPTVAATQVKNEFGNILEQAVHKGAVAITRHDKPKAVLLSFTEFESLVSTRGPALEALSGEFEQLLSQLQTAKAKKAMKATFNASPQRLGRAAVKAARKKS